MPRDRADRNAARDRRRAAWYRRASSASLVSAGAGGFLIGRQTLDALQQLAGQPQGNFLVYGHGKQCRTKIM